MVRLIIYFFTCLLTTGCFTNTNSTDNNLVKSDTANENTVGNETKSWTGNSFPEKDSIGLEFENYKKAGWGSVLGKPIDTIFWAKKILIKYGNNIIYSDSINHFIFYNSLKDYWPRLLKINGNYVYMFERNQDEPIGADIFMLTFTKTALLDTFSVQYDKYGIDLSKKLSDQELIDIYSKKKK